MALGEVVRQAKAMPAPMMHHEAVGREGVMAQSYADRIVCKVTVRDGDIGYAHRQFVMHSLVDEVEDPSQLFDWLVKLARMRAAHAAKRWKGTGGAS